MSGTPGGEVKVRLSHPKEREQGWQSLGGRGVGGRERFLQAHSLPIARHAQVETARGCSKPQAPELPSPMSEVCCGHGGLQGLRYGGGERASGRSGYMKLADRQALVVSEEARQGG